MCCLTMMLAGCAASGFDKGAPPLSVSLPSACEDLTAPVPDPGTTPVIPPPGSPGGNPQIDPK